MHNKSESMGSQPNDPMDKEGFGAKGYCAELRSLRIIIIGNDRLGLDVSAHFCGAKAFRQRRVGNRGPRTQQLVRGRLPLFHLFASG